MLKATDVEHMFTSIKCIHTTKRYCILQSITQVLLFSNERPSYLRQKSNGQPNNQSGEKRDSKEKGVIVREAVHLGCASGGGRHQQQ